MNSLSEIINTMDTTDKKDFVSYLHKKNKRQSVKNIQYFKYLETDDKIRIKNLYKNSKNKDAYHALRKRLYDNLIEFMGNRTFEKNTGEIHESLRYLVLSRYLFENNLHKTGFKNLAKAEEKAVQLEQFSLLNEIYQTQIQFVHLRSDLDINALSEKLFLNQKKLEKESKLNLGYALLRKELQEIHHQKKVVNFQKIIRQTMEKLGISFDEIITYKSLYQILFIANEFGNIYQNFYLIEPFVKSSYEFLENKKEGSENHLYYHIQIVYYLANFYFRTNQFETSQRYLAEMFTLMEKKNKTNFHSFYLRHQLVYALNLHYTGKSKEAINLTENLLKKQSKKTSIEEIYDVRASLISFLGQQNDRSALKELSKLNHSDAWFEKKLGMVWTIRKNLMEILIHTQFENTELALSRIQSFKRRYKKYLYETKEQRVMDYVLSVEQMIKKPDMLLHPTFKDDVIKMMELDKNRDPFILSFWAWIISRVEKKTPYEVVLELLKN